MHQELTRVLASLYFSVQKITYFETVQAWIEAGWPYKSGLNRLSDFNIQTAWSMTEKWKRRTDVIEGKLMW